MSEFIKYTLLWLQDSFVSTVIAPMVSVTLIAAVVFGPRVATRWLRALTVVGTLLYLGWGLGRLVYAPLGWDFQAFRAAGVEVAEGRNHYITMTAPPLNPPPALPFFVAFASIPKAMGIRLWMALNLIMGLGLAAMASRMLDACREHDLIPTPASLTWILAVAVANSRASTWGILAGQFSLLIAAGIIMALLARARCRSISSGLWLGLATIKPATMLPILLLYPRKKDASTWIAWIAVALALGLMFISPSLLLSRLEDMIRAILAEGAEGAINDYSYRGPFDEDMLGFDHLLYRFGLRDRGWISFVQLFLVLGLGVALVVASAQHLVAKGALCSLVCLYSMVFLYHRLYDTVLLTIPLTYSIARSVDGGMCKGRFSAAALAIVLVMNVPREGLEWLTRSCVDWGSVGRLIQILILPYATWLILAAMALIWSGSRRRDSSLPARRDSF
jgi:hypothetical protein